MNTQKQISSSQVRFRSRCPNGEINPVDVYVGKRIALRRKLLNLSQDVLAKKLGITFQQVQKYEKGKNRISASRLWDYSQILGVEINYFFQDMPQEIANQSPRMFHNTVNEQNILLDTPFDLTSEAQEILLYYSKIHHPAISQAITDLLKALTQSY